MFNIFEYYQRNARVMLNDVNHYDYLHQPYIFQIGGPPCLLFVNWNDKNKKIVFFNNVNVYICFSNITNQNIHSWQANHTKYTFPKWLDETYKNTDLSFAPCVQDALRRRK